MNHPAEPASWTPAVDGAGPLPPPNSMDDLIELALQERPDERLHEFREVCHQQGEDFLSLREDLDPADLSQAGWGLVVPAGLSSGVLEALEPLITRRCQMTGDTEFRLLIYHAGESGSNFLVRHGLGPGPVDPSRVPYYLLLIGPPSEIPFSFQQYLGVKHAVGRLDFEKVSDYRKYAENVVQCELAERRLERRVGLFGPRYDDITQQSNKYLFHPLREALDAAEGWTVDSFLGPEARKERHLDLVAGDSPPAFLLSVCHGLGLPCGHQDQRGLQGAQVCQPTEEADEGGSNFVAGNDIDDHPAGSRGQILFMNGCFSAGTPRKNTYLHRQGNERELCAPESFTAHLAQRLLAHPEGALAVIGHVDRTWNYTFRWPGPDVSQTAVFESASRALMQGKRVGAAIEHSFGHRFAELSVELAELQADCEFGVEPGLPLCRLWTARNDAKSIIVLGDPAVRLAVDFVDQNHNQQ